MDRQWVESELRFIRQQIKDKTTLYDNAHTPWEIQALEEALNQFRRREADLLACQSNLDREAEIERKSSDPIAAQLQNLGFERLKSLQTIKPGDWIAYLRSPDETVFAHVSDASIQAGASYSYRRTSWSWQDHEHVTERITESYYDTVVCDQAGCQLSKGKALSLKPVESPCTPIIFETSRLMYDNGDYIYRRFNEAGQLINTARVPLDGWHFPVTECLRSGRGLPEVGESHNS